MTHPEVGQLLHRPDGEPAAPLEELATLVGQRRPVVDRVVEHAAVEHQVVGPGDDHERIELEVLHRAHRRARCRRGPASDGPATAPGGPSRSDARSAPRSRASARYGTGSTGRIRPGCRPPPVRAARASGRSPRRGRRRRPRSRSRGSRPSRAARGRTRRASRPRKSVGPPPTPVAKAVTPRPAEDLEERARRPRPGHRSRRARCSAFDRRRRAARRGGRAASYTSGRQLAQRRQPGGGGDRAAVERAAVADRARPPRVEHGP